MTAARQIDAKGGKMITNQDMRRSAKTLTAGLGLLAVLASTPSAAQYGQRGHGHHGDYVTAESWYGKGTVSGPVRPGRHGWQVGLPRGTWIDCAGDCPAAVRQAREDFWERFDKERR